MVVVKTEKSRVVRPIPITENKNTQPLLGLDWLDKLEIGLQGIKSTNIIRNIINDEKSEKIPNEFEASFINNHRIVKQSIFNRKRTPNRRQSIKTGTHPLSEQCPTRIREAD